MRESLRNIVNLRDKRKAVNEITADQRCDGQCSCFRGASAAIAHQDLDRTFIAVSQSLKGGDKLTSRDAPLEQLGQKLLLATRSFEEPACVLVVVPAVARSYNPQFFPVEVLGERERVEIPVSQKCRSCRPYSLIVAAVRRQHPERFHPDLTGDPTHRTMSMVNDATNSMNGRSVHDDLQHSTRKTQIDSVSWFSPPHERVYPP